MNYKKIPTFLHSPRSGGTYVLSVNLHIFISYIIRKKLFLNNPDWFLSIRRLKVVDKNKNPLITAFVYDSDLLFKFKKNIYIDHEYDGFVSYIEISNFIKELEDHNIELFSIIIEPESAHLIKDNYFDGIVSIIEKKPLYYTTIRHPFERLQSLYNYLISQKSKHEPTHNRFKSKNFIEYISSNEPPHGWLIKRLAGIDQKVKTNERHLDTAICILKNFITCDPSDVDKLINHVFGVCYNIQKNTIDHNFINIDYNSSCKNKIKLEDLDPEVKSKFLEKSKFDIKLYDFFAILNLDY